MPTMLVPSMCSFITEAMPAAYMHLGIGNQSLGSTSELHTPTFNIDEAVRFENHMTPVAGCDHADVQGLLTYD